MPLYPQFEKQYTQQLVTDTFSGYDHQLKVADGEWYDTWNLTTDYAPMLANRGPWGFTGRVADAMIEKKKLAYIGPTSGRLYYNFHATGLVVNEPGEKQLVSMGAYIVVFPDKKYINTENLSDYGSLEAHLPPASASYEMVRYDGSAISATYTRPTAPANPQNGEYWIDTSGEAHVLKQWSDSAGDWISVETVFIKITFPTKGTVPTTFKENDGVTISGSTIEDVNGSHVIYALGGRAPDGDAGEADWIMIAGLLEQTVTDTDLVIDRTVPDLDFVCEAQNRLWGCHYGYKDGQTYNEIFCCALGDFRNWNQFQGISTDSWVGQVGSDGPWTGAVNYLGYPTFFKENRIHRVTISTSGAHQIDETVCRGVQKGSHKSLVVVNETLYYKSASDVCAYQGGFPTGVSQALGPVSYHDAVAGAVGSKYYISMLDAGNSPHLFIYDIAKSIWLHIDNKRLNGFACVDGELYAYDTENKILTMLGSLPDTYASATTSSTAPADPVLGDYWYDTSSSPTVLKRWNGSAWVTEEDTHELITDYAWGAISGVQYYEYPENKRLSRYNIRMRMEEGAHIKVYLRYDGDLAGAESDPNEDWVLSGQITATNDGIAHYVLPVRPRRCDHMQLAISGKGNVQIYSIAKVLEMGSDYR